MQNQEALDRAIAFASIKVPEAMEADEIELCSYTESISIKGVRLFAKRGWPILAQVLIGKKWITVVRGVDPSMGSNLGITAGAIKDRVEKSRLASKRY